MKKTSRLDLPHFHGPIVWGLWVAIHYSRHFIALNVLAFFHMIIHHFTDIPSYYVPGYSPI